jgi:hypothetical protein
MRKYVPHQVYDQPTPGDDKRDNTQPHEDKGPLILIWRRSSDTENVVELPEQIR